jgi:tRNA pseudouridine38-40 synthase
MDESFAPTASSSKESGLKRPREGLPRSEGTRDTKRLKINQEQPIINPDSAPGDDQYPMATDPTSKEAQKSRRDASEHQKSRKGKEKNEKNKGRRRGSRVDQETPEDDGRPKAPRLPKKQCALLIGFCGTGCAGMQMYGPLLLSVPPAQIKSQSTKRPHNRRRPFRRSC